MVDPPSTQISARRSVFTAFRRDRGWRAFNLRLPIQDLRLEKKAESRVKDFVSRGGKHSVRRKFAMEDRRTFNIQRRTSNGRKPNRRDRGWMMAA